MALSTITNALYDAKISSESATVTRVTDIDNELPPALNSGIPVKCTTDNGATIYLTYDELAVTATWTALVEKADGAAGIVANIDTVLNAQATAIDGFATPPTPAEYQSLIAALKVKNDMDPIQGN